MWKSLSFFRFRLNRLLLTAALTVALFGSTVFYMFWIFEKQTYRSIADANTRFSTDLDAVTETLNQFITDYGFQLYYSPTVQELQHDLYQISVTERTYRLRDLRSMIGSSDFATNIYILNDYTQKVYSTDSTVSGVSIDRLANPTLKSLLVHRSAANRYTPVPCSAGTSSDRDNYAFTFYQVDKDNYLRPGVMVLTVQGKWYRNMLLAGESLSNLLILDEQGSILMYSSEKALERFRRYGDMIDQSLPQSYGFNRRGDTIYFSYRSPSTHFLYLKFASLSELVPWLTALRQRIILILAVLSALFTVFAILTLLYTLVPMLRMRSALHAIHSYQQEDENIPGQIRALQSDLQNFPSLPGSDALENQLKAVVSRTERNALQQALFDMLSGNRTPEAAILFPDAPVSGAAASRTGTVPSAAAPSFGLLLIDSAARGQIYGLLSADFPHILIARYSDVCCALDRFAGESALMQCAEKISDSMACRCFISPLFTDFSTLPAHAERLFECHSLSLTLPREKRVISSPDMLNPLLGEMPLDSRDFGLLISRIRSGSAHAGIQQLALLLDTAVKCRQEGLRYILTRTETLILNLLKEFPNRFAEEHPLLLPENLDKVQHIDELSLLMQDAIALICRAQNTKKAEQHAQLIDEISDFIHAHFAEAGFSSQNISDQFHLNHTYLGRLFRSAMDCSVSDYINRCRIGKACLLLRDSDRTIEEIAALVGISNRKYFYVLFKKLKGVTPAEYRRKKRSGRHSGLS